MSTVEHPGNRLYPEVLAAVQACYRSFPVDKRLAVALAHKVCEILAARAGVKASVVASRTTASVYVTTSRGRLRLSDHASAKPGTVMLRGKESHLERKTKGIAHKLCDFIEKHLDGPTCAERN